MKEKTTSLRLFFAIDLDKSSRHKITRVIKTLRALPGGKKIHWEIPEKLHLTLRFIGSTNSDQISALLTQVRKRLKNLTQFKLTLGKVVAFPSQKKPLVVSLQIFPQDALMAIAHAVDQGVIASNFPPEKREFSPHLTLGRITTKNWPFKDTSHPFFSETEITEYLVSNVILFRSDAGSTTSIYSRIATIKLIKRRCWVT